MQPDHYNPIDRIFITKRKRLIELEKLCLFAITVPVISPSETPSLFFTAFTANKKNLKDNELVIWRIDVKFSVVLIHTYSTLQRKNHYGLRLKYYRSLWELLISLYIFHYFFSNCQKFIVEVSSSPPQVFLGISVLKICGKYAGEHTCQSVNSIKLIALGSNLIEITLRCGCFSYFQDTFFQEHLWSAASNSCI